MPNLLKTGSDWLQARQAARCSQSVVYSRGANSVAVDAVIGSTTKDTVDAGGNVVVWESRDFLTAAATLVLAGAEVEPARGDRITETQGGATYTYEVNSPSGEPCWRWSDAFRVTRRIHTKLIAVA